MRFVREGSPLGSRVARFWWVRRHRAAFGGEALGRSARPGPAQRLLVDVSVIIRHDARTGIQRVVRAVWLELQRLSGTKLQVIPIFASQGHGYCYACAGFLNGHGSASAAAGAPTAAGQPVTAGPGDIFLGLDLTAHLLPKYTAQIASWRTAGASIHLVVYDLLPITHPDWFQGSTRRNMGRWLRSLVRYADQALCISSDVAMQLQAWLDRHPRQAGGTPRIHTIRLGADLAATMPSTGLLPGAQAVLDRVEARPTVLMVGTIEPRKAYDVALRAFEHLWRTRPTDAPRLIIVGKPGWKTADLQARMRGHPERGRRFEWLDDASDEFLERLYGSCRAMLMTSRGEGFGLPVVEATSHDMPVLVRDLPAFREHGLPDAAYFDDDRPAALGDKLMALVSAPAKAAPSVSLPTWSDCVRDLLDAIGAPVPDTGKKAPAEAVA